MTPSSDIGSASHDLELTFTGERFIPNSPDADPRLRADHMLRYLASRELVRGRHVLDIACGEGYGSAMLAETAADVLGLDISPEAVAHATVTYGGIGNLRFDTASAASLPCDGETLDAVVSFETIEHLTAADQTRFIDEVHRVLRPSGLFIVSTPNRPAYAQVGAEYHYQVLVNRSLGDLSSRMAGDQQTSGYFDIEKPRFTLTQGPAWLRIDEATGVLSGTPDVPGSADVIVTAAIDRQVRKLDEAVLRWGNEKILSVDTERVGVATQRFVIDVKRIEP